MKIQLAKNIKQKNKADYLVLPFLEDKKEPVALFGFKEYDSIVEAPIKAKDFFAKEKQLRLVYSDQADKRILLLGLGKEKNLSESSISEIYAEVVTYLKTNKAKSVNIVVPENLKVTKKQLLKGIVEALFLANYSFDKYKHATKKSQPTPLEQACLIGIDPKDKKLVEKGKIIADGVNLTRDLVNNNADDETPQNLAKVAKSFEKISSKIKVDVFDKKRIQKEKMGLLLAVNRGSDKHPAFIIIEYSGNPSSKDRSVIVGKGITYDTGGLSLKPSASMDTMKSDMSGSAAVIGTMYTIAKLNLKVNVTCLVPSTENSIGPASYKPGDVYVGMNNKSVEVTNTDAEGRLILADALSYAVKKIKPNRIIDVASLTGACVVALGEEIAALISNNEKLSDKLENAAKRTGDHVWKLPLFKEYKKLLKSEIADIKNCSMGGKGGTLTAALFLEEFVDNVEWAHLDIAGPAFLSKPKGLHPTFATGVGVRLLVDFFENLEA